MKRILPVLAIMLILPGVVCAAAFPGCEGFGCDTRHAYTSDPTPDVYIIDTLTCNAARTDVSGTRCPVDTDFSCGTDYKIYASGFRTAMEESGPRIIIFDVAGEIQCNHGINVKSADGNLFVAGQTAPEPGIWITNSRSIGVTNYGETVPFGDVVIQHLRVRGGDRVGSDAKKAAAVTQNFMVYAPNANYPVSNVVIDHVSSEFSQDVTASIYGIGTRYVTLSNSIFSYPLNHGDHSQGRHPFNVGVGGGADYVSLIKNLIAHGTYRVPLLTEHVGRNIIAVNNLIYNWGYEVYQPVLVLSDDSNISLEGNVFDRGPDSPVASSLVRLEKTTSYNTNLYCSDNLLFDTSTTWTSCDSPSNIANNINYTASGSRIPAYPSREGEIAVISSSSVSNYVHTNAGAYPMWRDDIDSAVMASHNNQNGTYKDCVSDDTSASYVVHAKFDDATPTAWTDTSATIAYDDAEYNRMRRYIVKLHDTNDGDCEGLERTITASTATADGSFTIDFSSLSASSCTPQVGDQIDIIKDCGNSNYGGWGTMNSGSHTLTLPANPHSDDDSDGYTNLEEWIHAYSCQVEGPDSPSCGTVVPDCDEGQILTTCLCGGVEHSSGYCCNNLHQNSPCSTAPEARYAVIKTPSPPAINGDLSEFSGAPSIILTNPSGTTGTYRLLWDEQALYIAANVSDTQLNYDVSQRDGSGIWNDDCIEIMFDTSHDDGPSMGSNDHKVFVNIGNVQYDAKFNGSGSSWDMAFTSEATLTGTVNTSGDTDSGYTIEIAIPWSEWGVSVPSMGDVFGFELVMDDQDDSGSRLYTIWANLNDDDSKINSPDNWGDIIFTVKADTSGDSCIQDIELNNFISLWYLDSTTNTMPELMEAVGLWKAGTGCPN